MANDELRAAIDLLRRMRDDKRDESDAYVTEPRGFEAYGFACGLALAIGVLEACMD